MEGTECLPLPPLGDVQLQGVYALLTLCSHGLKVMH